MTTAIDETYEIGELGLRDEIPEILITNNRSMAHIPGKDSDEPVCSQTARSNSYKRKSISCYPDGYLRWCGVCLRQRGIE